MNLSELAAELNLSITTVSRVLNGDPAKYRISKLTADRVNEAARKHRVTPDPIGRGLRRGKLGIIGLVLPDITNPFFSILAQSIERELKKSGKAVLLSDSNEDLETESVHLSAIRTGWLEGLLLAPVGISSETMDNIIVERQIPVVMIDRVLPGYDVASVSLDNYHAGRLAAQHLLDAGHKQIGCLRGNPDSHADKERLRGMQEALVDAGLEVKDSIIGGAGYSHESGLSIARAILDPVRRPTALITLSGQGILDVMEVLSEMQLSVPQDLSVVAFDEQPWSSFLKPPLTTVVQPIEEMARQAVQLLLELGKGKGSNSKSIVLQARLHERQSVRTLK